MLLFGIVLFFTGVVQVLAAIIRVLTAKRQSSIYAIKLKRYLLFVAIYFSINRLMLEFDISETILWSYIFIIPPFVAVWYWNHVRTWDKKYKRIREFDEKLLLEVPCKERLALERLPKRNIQIIKLGGRLKVAQKAF